MFAPQRRAIFHLSSDHIAVHPPLEPAYFSTLRSHKSLEKHYVSRLSYLFARLDLLSSEIFLVFFLLSSLLLFSSLLFSSLFFSFLFSSLLFSSLLFSDSSHLCFSSVNVVGSLVSKLPSINTTQPFSRITGGIGDVCSGSSGQELLFVDFQRCLFDLGQDMPRRSWHHVSSFKKHESCRWLPAFLNCARYRISVTAPGAKPQCFLRGPQPPPFDLSQPCTKRSVHRCPEEFVGMVIFQRRWQWSIYGWWFTIKTRRLSIAMRNHRRVCLYIYISLSLTINICIHICISLPCTSYPMS